MKKVLLLTVLILLLSSVYLFSAVPCKINYQGRLIKDNVPVDGTKTMKFSIYDSAVGPALLWTSGEVDVTVHNGLFRYVLDLSSIDDWTAGETLYLEVKVETDILTPREELYAYPYAINSHLLEGKTKEYFLDTSGDAQTKQGNLNIMGNVGIGTTSPAHILDIIQPNSTVRIGWSAANLDDGSTGFTVGDSYLHLGGGEYKADSHRLISFGFHNTANSQMPAYIGYLQTNASGWTKGDLVFGTRGVITNTAPVERMRIDTAGNVGIGTTSPDAKLEIVKSASGDILNISSASENDGDLVTILNNGNVGIGTTSPGAKLEVAGNFRATGGIEPDWDSGWVKVDRINSWGLKTWTHNLNYFPRQIQWWFSTSNPGTWVGPVAWSKQDHWSNPMGVWITTTEIKFTIWHDRYVYRMFNASSWLNYNSGYYRILFWK